MKNELVVFVDTEAVPKVQIGKSKDAPYPATKDDLAKAILLDIGSLCEAVVTLIHVADHEGIKPKEDGLRECIKHLQEGVADATYLGAVIARGRG